MIRRESLRLVMALMVVTVALSFVAVFMRATPTPLLLGLLFVPLACGGSIVAARAPHCA